MATPRSFDEIDEEEGFTASILPLTKLRVEGAADKLKDEESKAVNG